MRRTLHMYACAAEKFLFVLEQHTPYKLIMLMEKLLLLTRVMVMPRDNVRDSQTCKNTNTGVHTHHSQC